MPVVDEEINPKSGSRQVVDTARPVGDVPKYEAVVGAANGREDVGEDQGVHEEALRELEGHALGVRGAYAPHALVDLEVVVARQDGDGGVQRRIVEYGFRDLVLDEPLRCRPRPRPDHRLAASGALLGLGHGCGSTGKKDAPAAVTLTAAAKTPPAKHK